jgi:hypothetical protein
MPKFPPSAVLVVDRDLTHAHRLVRMRWPVIQAVLRVQHRINTMVNETARSEGRQLYLYGAGRTAEWLKARGLDSRYARPTEPVVTNAWSAKLSAHGWMEEGKSAAAALDVVPLGGDGKPWTADDPWDAFVSIMAEIGPPCGLVHFHAPGKQVWDKPHLQLVEWSDAQHALVL